jgi:AraC-like DNA-binding protein
MTVSGILMIIILLGALQGIIIGFLLFFAKRQRQSNRLLAVLIWLMSLCSLNLYMDSTGIFYSSTFLSVFHALVPMVIVMPAGPLIWFYIRSSVDPAFRMGKRRRKYFLPALLDIIPQLAALLYIIVILTGLLKKAIPLGDYIDTYDTWVDIPRWLSLTIYIWMAAKYLAVFKKQQTGEQDITIKWLQQFIRVFQVFQVIWLIYLVPYVIPKYTGWVLDTFGWYPVYIPLAVLIYWLGIKGYLVSHASSVAAKRSAGIYDQLTPDAIEQTTTVLQNAMEKSNLYLDPSLNLAMLSQQTGITQKVISAVLNQHVHKSFNEFINEYRVAEFKRRIVQPGLGHLTITGIALECGFNSQATFQRTFKQFTGMSPSEYRDSGNK